MNKTQKQIIKKLKEAEKEIGKSPTRREIPKLAWLCIRHFGSFNKAKQSAGLEIKNLRITSFPKHAFDLDKDLAFIAAFLTADGHIYKDLKGFYFSSSSLEFLQNIEAKVKNKFNLQGIYRKGTGYGKSYKLLFFNKQITLFLINKGIPAGDKMVVVFNVPDWVKKDKELAREYLKILFYCEGCKCKHSKNTTAIKINFNKSNELLDEGINFMKSLQHLLELFNIKSTKIWITKGNNRKKDDKITIQMNFKIKSDSVDTFIKEIGWLK